MEIMIENTEMPKCCEECFAIDNHGFYPLCKLTHEQRDSTFDTSSKRMDGCPLKVLK